MKRMLDIMLAVLGLALLSPVYAAAAATILLTDGRPVLFRQRRVGRGGRDFVLLKFRSMAVRAGTENGSFDAGGTPRITPVGRLLRRSKLDELPQLWNVLRGEMSLVGPRPEIRRWVDAVPGRWARVLAVRPGITDPASIEFRDEEQLLAATVDPEGYYRDIVLPRKLCLYERYIETQTLLGDFGILLQTAWVVVAGRQPGSAKSEEKGRSSP